MSFFGKVPRLIACILISIIVAFAIPIVYKILVGSYQMLGQEPDPNDMIIRLYLALGMSWEQIVVAYKVFVWLWIIAFALILLALIYAPISCFISVFKGRHDKDKRPSVTLTCGDYYGVGQGTASASVTVTPLGTPVTLQSSNPNRVSFAQGSITGSGNVQLVISNTPSTSPNDVVLTAIASNEHGQDTDEKRVAVVELTNVNVEYPLANDNNGTFTSRANENRINLEAVTTPDILGDTVTWETDDDPRDSNNSGNPDDPAPGANVNFIVNPPAAPNGRGFPLSYRIRATLNVDGYEQLVTTYATQDERDQCRQEYIDMNKNRVPDRGDFVDAATYVDPGNFSFDEININQTYSVALFRIADRLQSVRNAFGQVMRVNSGYRNPVRNAGIPGAHPESRHIYGRAADIGVRDFNNDGDTNANMVNDPNFGNVGDDWAILANIATAAGASVESWNATGGWVHMQW